jgi:hypothetical protein
MTYDVATIATGPCAGRLIVNVADFLTPAEARRLARDLNRAADTAEHTLRCRRDGGDAA